MISVQIEIRRPCNADILFLRSILQYMWVYFAISILNVFTYRRYKLISLQGWIFLDQIVK